MVLLYALLKFAKEYAKPWVKQLVESTTSVCGLLTASIVSRPERICEARHIEGMS
jgi:hypothetical protein